jgi:hypothetical protein
MMLRKRNCTLSFVEYRTFSAEGLDAFGMECEHITLPFLVIVKKVWADVFVLKHQENDVNIKHTEANKDLPFVT